MLHGINRSQIANDTADVITGSGDTAVEVAVFKPTLIHAAPKALFAAEQTADIIAACDVGIHIAVDEVDSHRIGRGITVIAGSNQTTDPVAGCHQFTAEMTVDDLARSHALTLCRCQTTDVICTVYGCFAVGIENFAIKRADK